MLRLTMYQDKQEADTARVFANLMFAGKVKAALRLVSKQNMGGTLSPDQIAGEGEDRVIDILKSTFRDALCLRYGWEPKDLASHCICGKPFSVEHALSCPTGGFPIIRHNELRDITASLMMEVCHGVAVEPTLQTLSGEQMALCSAITTDDARVDIQVTVFWGDRKQRAFFDVRKGV